MTTPTASAAVAALQERTIAEPNDALRHAARAALSKLEHAEFAALVAMLEGYGEHLLCREERYRCPRCVITIRIRDKAQEAIRALAAPEAGE